MHDQDREGSVGFSLLINHSGHSDRRLPSRASQIAVIAPRCKYLESFLRHMGDSFRMQLDIRRLIHTVRRLLATADG